MSSVNRNNPSSDCVCSVCACLSLSVSSPTGVGWGEGEVGLLRFVIVALLRLFSYLFFLIHKQIIAVARYYACGAFISFRITYLLIMDGHTSPVSPLCVCMCVCVCVCVHLLLFYLFFFYLSGCYTPMAMS